MDIAQNISVEDMASIRLWLLQEGQRLEYARMSFEKEKREFEENKRNFEREKELIMSSVKEQARKTELESKTLATEKILFKQKLEILEGGFRTLCREREDFETEKEKYKNRYAAGAYSGSGSLNVSAYKSGVFFNGIDNVLALKKRYRDLLKIFHPDNLDGDSATVQEINREYSLLKDQF
ncbi:MAG: J domain-containing protein [Lachnospiraceae bacterium]|nr:J domain-containing protein [Lachnospiraceae bacterium]